MGLESLAAESIKAETRERDNLYHLDYIFYIIVVEIDLSFAPNGVK